MLTELILALPNPLKFIPDCLFISCLKIFIVYLDFKSIDVIVLDSLLKRHCESIFKNLGNQYRVVYERPKRARAGDAPVMSIVVDNSGSMDMPSDTSGCDYRIEKVRQTLRTFVSSIPETFLTQVMTFTEDCTVRQILTRDKAAQIRALSQMKGGGGTNIIDSVRTALLTLKSVPSTRRYLVYLTDAALSVDEEMQQEFDILLGQLKDARINCLWLGMVDEDTDGAFAHAAARTGGRFVIATQLHEVARVFEDLASRNEYSRAATSAVRLSNNMWARPKRRSNWQNSKTAESRLHILGEASPLMRKAKEQT